MSDSSIPNLRRSFGWVDLKRHFIFAFILGTLSVGNWFMLPAIQSLVIPNAPGGKTGPWVVRPIVAFHFGAVALMVPVTLPLFLRPFRQVWKRDDATLGGQHAPLDGQTETPRPFLIQASFLLAIYATAFVFYLFSWEMIGPDGIEQHLPWTTLTHSYRDIASLKTIPDGDRSDSIRQDGPWYSITLTSGRYITLSHDNEGSTDEELRAMAAYVAKRSGLNWVRRSDARPH